MTRAIIFVLAVTTGACAARGGVPRPFPGAALPPGAGEAPPGREEPSAAQPAGAPLASAPAVPSGLLTDVIRTALGLLGAPYRNGGSDPSGFDCSGFMQYVFATHGTALPREVRDQYGVGRDIDLEDVKAGDLVFFETVGRGASHVGMALGDGRFVHAPSARGVVRVEPYTATYWARRFVGARRLTEVTAPPAPSPFPGAVRSSR
jgi:cell wall-associated NlpC family hydrolase